MTSYENADVLVNALALAVNALGLSFVAFQVILARHEIAQNQEFSAVENLRAGRQATIAFWHGTVDIRTKWQSELPNDWDAEEIDIFVQLAIRDRNAGHDSGKWNCLVDYFAYLEGLAVAVAAGAYDLYTLDALAGDRLLAIHQNYSDFIKFSRDEFGVSALYVEFDWLAEQLHRTRSSCDDYVLFAERSPLPSPIAGIQFSPPKKRRGLPLWKSKSEKSGVAKSGGNLSG